MGQFLNSIGQVAKNYKPYDDWEQRQADERAQKEYLAANTNIPQDKLDLIKNKAETVVRATEIMDAKSEDNCEDMEQLTGMAAFVPMVLIQLSQQPLISLLEQGYDKHYNKKINSIITSLGMDPNNYHVWHDLEHSDNPEVRRQYPKIKELLEQRGKTTKKAAMHGTAATVVLLLTSTIGMILWGNRKQKEASRVGRYQAKQNELNGLENFVMYTPEQLEKAQEIAKNIPDEKDRNSFTKMYKELREIRKDKKAYKEWFKAQDPEKIEKLKQLTYNSEQLALGEQDKELIVDTVKEINIKAEEYSENLENAYDTLSTISWLLTIPAGLGINKIMKSFNTSAKVKTLVSILTPVIISLGIMMTGTVEQKKASRVGRYQARKELLNNPARLLAYSDDEMKKAEHIKADKQKKSFFEKLGQNFKFLGTYVKDKKEYNEYKKTTQKENEKLQKAFKEIEVTEEQKAEAKNLQKNVFRAFDEVDEMSQRYSEDIEAGCEIAKTVGNSIWEIGVLVGSAVLGVSVVKGKFPLAKIANGLTNMVFKKESSIRVAINNFYDVLKQDKNLMKEFQAALVKGKLKYFFERPEAAKIKDATEPLIEEFISLGRKGLSGLNLSEISEAKFTTVVRNLFNDHLKQGRFAKWARNLLGDISKLIMKNKSEKIIGVEIPDNVAEKMGLNFSYKNYKTLMNTSAFAGIPILGVIFSVPYAFNSWLTNIQKKAGKIGIMKAMDKIDDPRVFAPENIPENKQQKEVKEVKDKPQTTNLLAQFRH